MGFFVLLKKERIAHTLVGTLLELLVVGGLLNKVEDLSGELVVGQREGFGVGGLFEKKKNEEKKEKEKKVKERNHLEPRENQEEIAKVVLTILFRRDFCLKEELFGRRCFCVFVSFFFHIKPRGVFLLLC